jgi:hypothetical protein
MPYTLLFIILLTPFFPQNNDEAAIRNFIREELKYYPEAHLRDIYKNYFQDAYGPGHIIPDTSIAGAYLDEELKNAVWKDTLLWQALGTNHDYYRINLILVKNGRIPRSVMLEGLRESVPLARKPDIESWKKEWNSVVEVIGKMGLHFPEMQADKETIRELLDSGDVVMHHSRHYRETYHPHYRIVHKSVFERWGKKYLSQ